MLRRCIWILLIMFAVLIAGNRQAAAQDFPPIEVFGGFSALSVGGPEDSIGNADRENVYGWQFSGAFNLTPVLGIVADFGGHYESFNDVPGIDIKVNSYEFLFGPRLNARGEKAAAFAHALIGGTRGSLSTSQGTIEGTSDNGFLLGLGGGIDWNVTESFGIRVLQFDWLPSRNEGEWSSKDVRYGFGVVYRFIN
ncbi:MAG: hypothetical protein A3F68_09275 [Acidobacteria bacterium RIFCSPLOWO2_12_FULL_54_10]|nr:MAG: hypothetical protein A3F68_09275 [Acidobacteria bacterium RIFCSPLOWO2_12_FULL_54_10]